MTNAVAAVAPVATGARPLPDAAELSTAGAQPAVTRLSLADLLQHQATRLDSMAQQRLGDPAVMAERILESIDLMRQDYNQLLGKADQLLDGGPATRPLAGAEPTAAGRDGAAAGGPADPHLAAADAIREMLAVQLDMGRLMVHEQLVSSTAGKNNQNLDTLLRGQ